MAKLTGRQKQAIIARYLAGESISNLAKEYNVSYQALAKQVKKEKVQECLKSSNIEQTATMIAFMQSRREQAQEIIDELFSKLQDKIDKASFKDCISGIKDLAGLYIERETAEETSENKSTEPPVIQFVFADTSIKKDDTDKKDTTADI